MAQLRQEYYLIRHDEYKCTNASRRHYEEASAAAYASLNSCILGTSEVPTTLPPTITPEQPSPEPTPTIAPPTSAPEITATPEVSTDEPIDGEQTTPESDITAGFDY